MVKFENVENGGSLGAARTTPVKSERRGRRRIIGEFRNDRSNLSKLQGIKTFYTYLVGSSMLSGMLVTLATILRS